MSKPFSQINRCLNRYQYGTLERFLRRFRATRCLPIGNNKPGYRIVKCALQFFASSR